MNDLFKERVKLYFKDKSDEFLLKLNEPCTHGFFLNSKKASNEEILKLIDFDYFASPLTDFSFYHKNDNIGKTFASELGLIYPQGIEASLPSLNINPDGVKIAVDLCAAPGGKSINALTKLSSDTLFISNEVSYKRCQILSSNLERLGFDNVIITNKSTNDLADRLEGLCDLVLLDAPCSGEGMIRKYPEILDTYNQGNILAIAKTQSELLEDAYRCLKSNGILIYSTCTYAFEEDEDQVNAFLNKHSDMQLISDFHKYSFLDDTEGQFYCVLKRNNHGYTTNQKYLKPVKNKLIDSFINENIKIDNYYLYKNNNNYYLSLIPMLDMGNNVLKYGIYVGEIIKDRFEPSHHLYRTNSLIFNYKYDLNKEEYSDYIKGLEIHADIPDHYYQLTYLGYPIGYGKCSKGQIKNKFPKGLRRMI